MTAITSIPEPRYYERMATALGDKARMIDFLLPGTVIDVGCGGGDFLDACTARGFTGVGTDAYASEVASSRGHRVFPLFANETHLVNSYDHPGVENVAVSAVLHEVFSYGNRHGKQGRIDSLALALRSFRKTLRAGGRLIIRDGVSPGLLSGEEMREDIYVEFADPALGDLAVAEFLKWSPYVCEAKNLDRSIRLAQLAPGRWCGRGVADLAELAFTLNWTVDALGQQAFVREAQEFYGVFTLDGYTSFVEEFGFRLVHAESYVQPGYVAHMDKLLQFKGCNFPDTNALWVYEAV